jgi:holin-like protein
MVAALAFLLVLQLVGEVLTQVLALPVPGPVIGMALLFVWLLFRGGPSEALKTTSQGLLTHLSLLFVPAGTGVILHWQRMADEWLPLSVALLLSTALTLMVSAWVLSRLSPQSSDPASAQGPSR